MPTPLEHHMSDSTQQQCVLPRKRATEIARMSLRLPVIVTGILLSIMPLLTGCGGGGEADSQPSITMAPGSAGVTASLEWNPVQDPSVSTYFVHYGRQSPGQQGSCAYESSMPVDSPSATITNLDPNTLYYFTVSAYNGLESPCSNEVSTVTPPASV
jgi:Fibronectin type III domain